MDLKKKKPSPKKAVDRWPDPVTLKKIRDRFTYPEGDHSNIVAPKDASEIDLFKIKLCHLIDGYRIERGLKKKQVAQILGIDEARMSEMMNGKIERYTIERLFGYLKALDPGFSLTLDYRESR